MIDVIDDFILLSHVVLFEWPHSLILIQFLLILLSERQEEVVEELVTDYFLLITHLCLDDLTLFEFLLAIDLTVFLTVVILQGLELLG